MALQKDVIPPAPPTLIRILALALAVKGFAKLQIINCLIDESDNDTSISVGQIIVIGGARGMIYSIFAAAPCPAL